VQTSHHSGFRTAWAAWSGVGRRSGSDWQRRERDPRQARSPNGAAGRARGEGARQLDAVLTGYPSSVATELDAVRFQGAPGQAR
jgi:hypothetical protein